MLNSLNDIIVEAINDGQPQFIPNDSLTSFRTVHSNFPLVGHSTKLPGYITIKMSPPQSGKNNNQIT